MAGFPAGSRRASATIDTNTIPEVRGRLWRHNGAELLVDHGAEKEACCEGDGFVSLHYASIRGYLAVAKMLLNKGASLEAEDVDGHTPLDLALTNSELGIARLCLERGAVLGPERIGVARTLRSQNCPSAHLLLEFEYARGTRAERKLARRICAVCERSGHIDEPCFQVCDACSRRRYCSEECQRQDWFELGHRERCPHLRQLGPVGS